MSSLLQRVTDAARELAGVADADLDQRFEAAVAEFQDKAAAIQAARQAHNDRLAALHALDREAAQRLQALTATTPALEYEAIAAHAADLARAREASRVIDDMVIRLQAQAELERRRGGQLENAYINTLGILAGELQNERNRLTDGAPIDPHSPARPRITRRLEAIDSTLQRIARFRLEIGLIG